MVGLGVAFLSNLAIAQKHDNSHPTLEEVVVTVRYRAEKLHNAPDSITVFTQEKIQNTGIDEVEDFINLTPNMIVRETFRSGATFITIRGVTTAQQGWAPVTYIVDGVKAGVLDAINQGALIDIERIEVLKGPQGALYGAGAIAGAINVVTRSPSNEQTGRITASYGEGNNRILSGIVSGPLIEDKLLYRLGVYYSDADGLIDSTDGDDIDFENQKIIRGRLLYQATDSLNLDFRGAYSDIHGGAAMQDIISDAALIDHFDSTGAPGPRRGIVGEENRRFNAFSLKAEWETDIAVLTSVSGYQRIDQDLYGSVSWDKPPVSDSLFGPIFGQSAVPGQAIDDFQNLVDDFEVYSQNLRLTSTSEGNFRWVVGAEYLQREAITQLGIGRLMAPNPGTHLYIIDRWDERTDRFSGVYAQINYDITNNLELTIAGRHDKNNYDTHQFDPITGQTINAPDESGNLVIPEFTQKDSKFQPKVQLSYDWSDSLMTYVTWAKGFRSGFFSIGNPTRAEETDNVEVGFKATALNGLLQTSGAVFYVNYSDQQNTTVIPTPPFRLTSNIPKSTLKGVEWEVVAKPIHSLALNASLGYIDTKIDSVGIRTPATPDWTANLGVQYTQPLGIDTKWVTRFDYRYQGRMYLKLDVPPLASEYAERFWIKSKDYINLRTSIETHNWLLTAFINNALDTQQTTDIVNFGGKHVRTYSKPRAWGFEISYQF